jgi:hypothetical protein
MIVATVIEYAVRRLRGRWWKRIKIQDRHLAMMLISPEAVHAVRMGTRQ